jgi:flavin reductase (DIM6/NTAB) family NADH-FMN oxidoreductase RutF
MFYNGQAAICYPICAHIGDTQQRDPMHCGGLHAALELRAYYFKPFMTHIVTAPSAPHPATRPTAQAMRSALGLFATGVTIVTARAADGSLIGLTANSFNSVSLTPPLVLWSLGLKSGALQTFLQAKHYAIHVLSVEQQALAERFASKSADRFDGLQFADGQGDVPIIPGCAAVFECTSRSQYPEGDHVILVGEVIACQHDATRSPLLFHGGKFYTEHAL